MAGDNVDPGDRGSGIPPGSEFPLVFYTVVNLFYLLTSSRNAPNGACKNTHLGICIFGHFYRFLRHLALYLYNYSTATLITSLYITSYSLELYVFVVLYPTISPRRGRAETHNAILKRYAAWTIVRRLLLTHTTK